MEKKFPEILVDTQSDWPQEKPITLMFMDEARFGRIADIRYCWCPVPFRPLCCAMVTQQNTYAYAAVSVRDGSMDSLVLPWVNTTCMQLFLDEVAARRPDENIVMVMDGAGWHRAQALHPAANMRIVHLPPYAPELNPVEHVWDELREKFFHNRVFDSIEALELYLATALLALENDPARIHSIVAWEWIINARLK